MKNKTQFRVGKILQAKGMSINEFAQRSTLDYNTARALAKGLASRIGLETIDKACDALNVQPGELFERTPHPSN